MKDMSAVNEARATAMVGTSPLERGREKDAAALMWVWRWGWSSASTTDSVVAKQRGVVKRLADKKLLRYHETEGYRSKYYPARVIVLSKAGVELLGDRIDLKMRHITAEDVAWHQLRHDHAVQVWTAKKLQEGLIVDYITPREMAKRSEIGAKQPDAIWTLNDGAKMAIELELTYKKPREKHGMISKLTRLLSKGAVDHVLIVTQSEATAQDLRKLIAPGARRPQWVLFQRKYISQATQDVAPDWLSERITIEVLP